MLAWLRRHPLLVIVVALFAAYFGYIKIAVYYQGEQAVGHKMERCHTARLCREYGLARQQCAVAGNFDACMRIKGASSVSFYCTEDGQLAVGRQAWIECLFLTPLDALSGYFP